MRNRIKSLLPEPARRVLTRPWKYVRAQVFTSPERQRVGRTLTPASRQFGFDRGLPVDRFYIESFLARHAADVHGRVLEVKDNAYTVRFGKERVTRSEVLDIDATNPNATIIDDLTVARNLPHNAFDCVVLTQTLQLIYEVECAVRNVYRALKPGGVLLATMPGITHVPDEHLRKSWYWSFTQSSARRVCETAFPEESVTVEVYGNVLSATGFLHGLVTDEFTKKELTYQDPDYQLIIAVRAVKPEQKS